MQDHLYGTTTESRGWTEAEAVQCEHRVVLLYTNFTWLKSSTVDGAAAAAVSATMMLSSLPVLSTVLLSVSASLMSSTTLLSSTQIKVESRSYIVAASRVERVFISEREVTFTFAICYRPSVCLSVACRLSSVACDARAPYSAGWNFRQYFYGIWHLGHPLTSAENLRRSSQGNPSAGGFKNKRGSQI